MGEYIFLIDHGIGFSLPPLKAIRPISKEKWGFERKMEVDKHTEKIMKVSPSLHINPLPFHSKCIPAPLPLVG